MNITQKQARYDLARQLKPLTLEKRRAYINKMIKNGTARVERHGSSKVLCIIFGRTATSTMIHVDWYAAVAVKNWIEACLEKDAPEGAGHG